MEHVDHEDPIDKSKRTRVRFNVEGPHGHGMAYAEVGWGWGWGGGGRSCRSLFLLECFWLIFQVLGVTARV